MFSLSKTNRRIQHKRELPLFSNVCVGCDTPARNTAQILALFDMNAYKIPYRRICSFSLLFGRTMRPLAARYNSCFPWRYFPQRLAYAEVALATTRRRHRTSKYPHVQ
jgi:hypothetical protein